MRTLEDLEKHIDNNSTTDKEPDQVVKETDLIKLWESGKVIVIEDDGEYE
jgi:hypothetical protein